MSAPQRSRTVPTISLAVSLAAALASALASARKALASLPTVLGALLLLLLLATPGAVAEGPAASESTQSLSSDPILLERLPAAGLEGPGSGAIQLRLRPAPELGAEWSETHVARAMARTVEGQRRLLSGALSQITLPGEACSLLVIDVALPRKALRGLTRSDAWDQGDHLAKRAVCPTAAEAGGPARAAAARRAAGGLLGARTGGRLEIRPLLNPLTARPGSDLAVRLYRDGAAGAGLTVTARGPEGRTLAATADSAGVAVLSIPAAGAWQLSVAAEAGGRERVASLAFTVEGEAFWQAALAAPAEPTRASMTSDDRQIAQRTGAWRPLGPAPLDGSQYAGRIAALATSSQQPGLYLAAAASGGLWKSNSAGQAWRPLDDDLPTLALGAVAFDPSDDHTLYAGSGESHHAYHSLYGLGLYKSTNGGATWRVLAPETFAGRTISDIVVSPTDPQRVWVSVNVAGGAFGKLEGAKKHPRQADPTGVFRSDDGGETWTQLVGSLPSSPASDLELDPADPDHLYVVISNAYGGAGSGVYHSFDGGDTFQLLRNLAGLGRCELAVAPSNPARLYLLTTNTHFQIFNWGGYFPFGGSTAGLFHSTDGGATWAFSFPGSMHAFQGGYNNNLVVHPSDSETVLLAGVSLVRSQNGGASFVNVTPPHLDVHEVLFDAAGRLLTATDGGVYRSTDLGDSWIARNAQLGTIQFYPGLSVDPTNPHRMLGGSQDNGTLLRASASDDWTSILGGDGGYTAIHPADPEVIFVEFQGTGSLFRSNDDGLSFTQINVGIDPFDVTAFQAPFLLDPTNPDRMLYGTHRIYESTNRGDLWTPISADLTDGDPNTDIYAVRSLAIAPSDPAVVYATTNNQRLLVSSDGGATWTLVRTDAYGWPRILRQVAVDPGDPDTAFVAIGSFGSDRVLATADRGVTWAPLAAGLPDVPVNAVAAHRDNGQLWIFAATDRGVFVRAGTGGTWSLYGKKMPNAPVMDLLVDTDHNRLVAATLGRGVWVTGLP